MTIHLDDDLRTMPKAELHVHIEGTVTPAKCRELAAKNNVVLAPDLFTADGSAYQYNDFFHLVTSVYDNMAQSIRTKADYEDITYDYLSRCADEGTLYVEMIAWCSAGKAVGLGYKDMIEGMAAGIDRAQKDTGIIGRINTTLVRHQPLDVVWEEAKTIAAYNHPYIVGLDVAGGEAPGDLPKYQPLFDHIFKNFGRPLGMRVHAGEAQGADNVDDALYLNPKPTRIGHGVRSIEDKDTVQDLVDNNVVLEICPTSNVLANIYPSYAAHPLRKLMDAGVPVCLNSDDPGLFGNSIGMEYQVARDHFGFTNQELLDSTRTAISAAFIDRQTKAALIRKVDAWGQDFFKGRASAPGPRP
ncbi:MAG: adenosine deaminase [Micavibrio sp.]